MRRCLFSIKDGVREIGARSGAAKAWLADDPALVDQIRLAAPGGIHRIAEVDFATHIDIDASVIATGGAMSACHSSADRLEIPYWKLAFAHVASHSRCDGPDQAFSEFSRDLMFAVRESMSSSIRTNSSRYVVAMNDCRILVVTYVTWRWPDENDRHARAPASTIVVEGC